MGQDQKSSQATLEGERSRPEAPSRQPSRFVPHQGSEKMDIEEVSQQQGAQLHRTVSKEGPRLVPSKKALYGEKPSEPFDQPQRQPTRGFGITHTPMHHAPIQQSTTQNFGYQQVQPAFMTSTQSAVAAPNMPNAPPLFVGFLTNDVSMGQIRNLFTS